MSFPAGNRRLGSFALRLLAAGVLLGVIGCNNSRPPEPAVTSRYQTLPPKNLPEFLKGTVMERVDVANVGPKPVSNYGLVARLLNTGDTRVPNTVREYMINTMQKRGFGSRLLGFESMPPEKVLSDPSFAIVRVDGLIPPGARRGQRFDIQVSALPGNNTSSLAHGSLYRTDLKENGADPRNPGMTLDIYATAEGEIFVNPAYALEREPGDSAARSSLRTGVVIGGGVVQIDRPLALRLRQPSYAISRQIEQRLDDFFQNDSYAAAMDEGVVLVRMPPKYGSDWEHFRGVITHVYFNSSPAFVALKAQELAREAVKPDAPLLDISYCWEALGTPALPFVTPLMTHPQPDVAYAAARAAAFLGDVSAQRVLIEIARSESNPYQLNAVQTLAKLTPSPEINAMLRTLLTSPSTLVRLEAYEALAAAQDMSIFSRAIHNRFWLDIIPGDGEPLIYATRRGAPRLAIFGQRPALNLPVTFSAMDGQFSISSQPGRRTVTIFYRGPGVPRPVRIESNPDIAEIAARLGGAGPLDEPRLNFTYCDVVAIVQALADQNRLSAGHSAGGNATPVAFVLQDLPFALDPVYDAPPIPGSEPQRPQTDSPGTATVPPGIEGLETGPPLVGGGNPNVEFPSPE